MFDTDKIEINAAFYELFESVFNEDFFEVLSTIRPSNRIKALRERATVIVKEGDEEKKFIDMSKLEEDEQKELTDFNIKAGLKAKKYTSRIAYIGTLLHEKKYQGSYQGFMAFLASCDANDFLNPEITRKIWEKITKDQTAPSSVKNV